MKKILFVLLIASNFIARAQVYNNEWIDYTKTYYKFKIAKDGICRVSQSVLNGAGLGAVPAEQFQLWRNGVQVPLHTSVATGPLPANGFIEFWGKMNDGKADKQLYRNPSFQLNDKWNLYRKSEKGSVIAQAFHVIGGLSPRMISPTVVTNATTTTTANTADGDEITKAVLKDRLLFTGWLVGQIDKNDEIHIGKPGCDYLREQLSILGGMEKYKSMTTGVQKK